MRHEPQWWYRPGRSWQSILLRPAAALYGAVTQTRWVAVTARRVGVPVMCIGNYTAGGSGKTPAAIAVARLLAEMGERPVFLSRGYGGRMRGPHMVDPKRDTAVRVGDEPLLLARTAATVVSADRVAGAALAQAQGASVIVMDDGFQNPSLVKDFCLIVVDAGRGLGNGRIIPAGPLRAPLVVQMARTDALLLVGEGSAGDPLAQAMAAWRRPVLRGAVAPAGDTSWLRGTRVVAFAGIANPARFFATVAQAGADIVAAHAFPDHHLFTGEEAKRLLGEAQAAGALLVTTEKDWVRLSGRTPALKALKDAAEPVPVAMVVEDREALAGLLAAAMARAREAIRGPGEAAA